MILQPLAEVKPEDWVTIKNHCRESGRILKVYLGEILHREAEAIRQKQSKAQGK